MRVFRLSVYCASVTDLEVQSFQNKKSLRDLAEMRLVFFSSPTQFPPPHTCPFGRSVYQLEDGASLQCQWNCGQSLISFSFFFLVGCQIDATVKAISRLDSIAADSPAFAGSTGN